MAEEQGMHVEEQGTSNELNCTGCGSVLHFNPGTSSLKCQHCGTENEIETSNVEIEEIDYEAFMQNQYSKEEKIEVADVKCDSCGAAVTFDPNVTADQCPYCASNLVIESGSTSSVLKPKSVLPFAVDKTTALGSFRKWISSRWFAPSDLKEKASKGKLEGIYIPYWTYDSNTHSYYTGQRGDYYYVTESYTTTENGETVTKTRQVRKTRWTMAAGQVRNVFDDILIIASHSLPLKYTEKLEPWNLNALQPYNDKFLGGFRSESYQVDVATGLNTAKEKMEPVIYSSIRRDIGGDEQRVFTVNTNYHDITFKHILLPIWISSYRYKNKVYRFLVNGQTGEVQGERPYSALKITVAVLLAIAAIVAAIIIFGK